MSLKFRFTFHGSSVEVHPRALADQHPVLAQLRKDCKDAAGGDENLGDQAMAGVVAIMARAHGEAYLTRGLEGFKKIIDARNVVTGELQRALDGAAPDFAKMRKAYEEIDLAIPEVVHPKDATPPQVPLDKLLAGGVAEPRIKDLADFVSRVPKEHADLGPDQKALLDKANQDAPDALRDLLRTESMASLDWSKTTIKGSRPFEALMAALDRAGWKAPEVAKLADTVRGLKEAYHKRDGAPETPKAHVDDTIAALADPRHQAPAVDRLQKIAATSPAIKRLAHENPSQLVQWWRDFLSEPRTIGFHRYVAARMNLVKGHLGEYTAAFDLGHSGVFVFLKGPKADVNSPGTDLICFNVHTGIQFYIDNKALKVEVLNGVTALIRNFPQNLVDDIAMIKASEAMADPKVQAVAGRAQQASQRIDAFLKTLPNDAQLRKDRLENNYNVTLSTGERRRVWDVIGDILNEHGIVRMVTNAGGDVEALRKAIRDAHIMLENLNAADKGDVE